MPNSDIIELFILKFQIENNVSQEDLVIELAKRVRELQAENEVLKKSETHLKSAETALIEKDAKIKTLSDCYSAVMKHRDELLERYQKAKNALAEKEKEIDNRIAIMKGLEKHIDLKDSKIKELESTVRAQSQVLDVLNKKIEMQHDKTVKLVNNASKYRAALLDMEGTMCAQRDHAQQLSASIHKLLNED